MPLPDTGGLLEVQGADLVAAVRLRLLKITLLEELLDEEEKHARVAREEVFNLVQRHVLRVAWRLKGAFDEVVGACNGYEILQLGEVIRVELVVFDQLCSNFCVLGPGKTTNQTLFEVGHILDEHFSLLHLVDVNEIDAELQYVKLVVEAKLHDAGGRVHVSGGIQVLLRQVEKVVGADLQLEVLHVVVDHLGANRPKLVHGVLLMLRLDRDGPVLYHEAKVIQGDSDHEDGYIIPNRACFEQVDCEVEDVVVLRLVELPGEDELVHLAHFWVHNCAICVFDDHATLIFPHVKQNFTDQDSAIENSWKIV